MDEFYGADYYSATEEDIKAMLFCNACKYNEGVSCIKEERKPYQCEKCGWNPKIANRRKRIIRKEHGYGSN